MSSDDDSAEAKAFVGWVKAVGVSCDDVADLANGKALFDVLAAVDSEHFQNPHAADGEASTSYVLKLGTLRRLYKLMLQYYTDSLSLDVDSLPEPALDELARSSTPPHAEICKLCRLAIGITVNSEKTKADHIAAIQSLSEAEQGKLMVAIDAIMSATKPSGETRRRDNSSGEDVVDGDASSAALAASNKARAELEATYLSLADSHATLKTAHEDLQSERDSLTAELTQLRSERTRSQTFGVDAVLRDELDSLRSQLRKSENQLAEAEAEVERLSNVQRDQTKKLADLQGRADEATKLKDQLDEYRHLASKAQRTENALEKYKKRLEEASGLRRQLKDLESQNTSLVDRNASLEGECARLSESKPLVEHYKVRVEEVEERNRRLEEEVATQRYNLEQTTQEVRALEEARGRDAEMLSTWQERAQELELSATTTTTGDSSPRRDDSYDGAFNDDGGDLDLKKSLDGASTTDLKLRIHSLTRELKRARGGDGSRVPALEKLLDDAQRSRKRYEEDYWVEYRARLKLAGDLERIRKAAGEKDGKGEKESALALRLRLDEVEEELQEERKRFDEAKTHFEQTEKDLAVARSDLSLVGRDQTSILTTLRASVASENSALASQLATTKADLAHSREAHATLSDRIQALLMDKIALLDGGAGGGGGGGGSKQQAEEMRAALLAFTNGRGGKGEGEGEDVAAVRRKLEALQERFAKAKLFIKEQDRLLREARANRPTAARSTSSSSDAGSSSLDDPVSLATDELSSSALRKELEAVKMERDYMMGAWWHLAAKMQQPSSALPKGDGRGGVVGAGEQARSWLGQQQRRGTTVAWALGRR